MYGMVRSQAGGTTTDSKCNFRFPGQYEDEETGLCYNRFRYYMPSEGMYTQRDPIGLAGGNPTLYGYTWNSLTQVDPLGLWIYYQLMNNGEIVYHGITDRIIQDRLIEHARDGKLFNQFRNITVADRIDARNLEGSALSHAHVRGDRLLNSQRPVSEGFYHQYDVENIKKGRTFLSQDQIDSRLENATISNVDKKGRIIRCPG